MSNHKVLSILSAVAALIASAALCSDIDRELERGERAEQQSIDQTSAALRATSLSRNATQTSEAQITASPTSTSSPVPPTPTATSEPNLPTPTPTLEPISIFSNLPAAALSFSDPEGDTAFCNGTGSVEDSAVDILQINIYEPAEIVPDYEGWLVRVELGERIDDTFAEDWSAALLFAYSILGAPDFTVVINETHALSRTVGIMDPVSGQVIPGTEDSSFFDDVGFVWIKIPRETHTFQIVSFHLPLENLPEDQKRCDGAPDTGFYTLEIP